MATKTLRSNDGKFSVDLARVALTKSASYPQDESAELRELWGMLTEPTSWELVSYEPMPNCRPVTPGYRGRQEGLNWRIDINPAESLTLSSFIWGMSQPDLGQMTIFATASVGPKPPGEKTNMDKVEHVVLLMMENRSFDSLLGWLYEKGAPAKNVPALQPQERPYHGLQGLNLQDYENVDATGTIRVKPIKGAKGLNVPNIAPGENFTQVLTQLFDWPFEMTGAPPIQMTPGGVLVASKWRRTTQ